MPALYPLPRIWLFSDARNRNTLFQTVMRLPTGSGVVFRDYDLPQDLRRERFHKLGWLCRQYGHTLLVAGDEMPGEKWLAHGYHNRPMRGRGIVSFAVHNTYQLTEAIRKSADIVFVSPVYRTASHPDQKPLGQKRALALAAKSPVAAIALGGVTKSRFERQLRSGFYGWAAIDGLNRAV